ncbi:MAG: hypothetical protein JJV96_00310 [Alphaproteobacteria bacterium]|nr:hypothetical protein [Alphaproteobacteria bacterium]
MKRTILNKTVGVGVLEWKAEETLSKSLESYKKEKIIKLFDEALIHFQDGNENDKTIAKKFGFKASFEKNSGFLGGMVKIFNELKTDYVLFLENDFPLIVSHNNFKKQLENSVQLLEENSADVVRLFSKKNPGDLFSDVEKYLRYYKLQNPISHNVEKLQPSMFKRFLYNTVKIKNRRKFIGRAVYVEKNPHKIFPKKISKVGEFFIVDSSVINWTNRAVLLKRKFFLETLLPYINDNLKKKTTNGFQTPENILRKWWQDQHFKVAVGEGAFTHSRKDNSWRENYPFKKNI